MPIYEYECTQCKELHEALQKVSDERLTECPACGKSALRKKVSAAAFRLKGSGWYETDFKSGNKKNLAGDGANEATGKDAGDKKAGADSGSSSGGDDGKSKASEAKADSKPASSTPKTP